MLVKYSIYTITIKVNHFDHSFIGAQMDWEGKKWWVLKTHDVGRQWWVDFGELMDFLKTLILYAP